MSELLDEFYAVLMGFGIKRDWIDLGILSVLGISDGLAIRGVIDAPSRVDAWAFAVGVGWLSYVCYRYVTSEGGAS